MGFTEVLTIIFIVLKLLGVINWNWFFVLLPELIAFGVYAIAIVIISSEDKEVEKTVDDDKKEDK